VKQGYGANQSMFISSSKSQKRGRAENRTKKVHKEVVPYDQA
jgi:hypothetical protein